MCVVYCYVCVYCVERVCVRVVLCMYFSKACISRSTFFSWVSQDRTSGRNKPWPGRPTEAVAPTMVVNVEFLFLFFFVSRNHRGTLQEVGKYS